jgi:hypothetical protein
MCNIKRYPMVKELTTDTGKTAPPKFMVEEDTLTKQPLPDGGDWMDRIGQALGLRDRDLSSMTAMQLINANSRVSPSPDNCKRINGIIAAVSEINPKDTLETMLGCQMVTCNSAIMRLMEQFTNETVTEETVNLYLKTVNRLMLTYARQLEALSCYRRKGHQKMTVEHVTIENGGQAVIGDVTGGRQG